MKTLANIPDLINIRARLAGLTPSDQAVWGQMNVAQMICHLSDSFRVPLGEVPTAPLKISSLPIPIMKWFAFKAPMKWPRVTPTLPEVKHDIGGTPPAEFQADLRRLLRYLDAFAEHTAPWASHPIFGPLTTAEWMRWGYLHCDHHLRQFGR